MEDYEEDDDNWSAGEDETDTDEDDEDVIDNRTGRKLSTSSQPGDVYSFGYGFFGQLGLNQSQTFFSPQKNPFLEKIVKVACGEHHSVAVSENGSVFTWGCNRYGQLGLGDIQNRSKPVAVKNLSDVRVVSAACGTYHSVFLTAAGEVFTCGNGLLGRLGHGEPVSLTVPKIVAALRGKIIIQAACGAAFTACISNQGILYTWGCNRYGQIGHGKNPNLVFPRNVSAFHSKFVNEIQAGKFHLLVLLEDGQCFAMGLGTCGQLGNKTRKSSTMPILVEDFIQDPVKKIACGYMHSLALTGKGQIYIWGYVSNDHLGLPESHEEYLAHPILVDTTKIKTPIDSILAGGFHSACITSKGELYTWGYSADGRLGFNASDILPEDCHPTSPCLVGSLKGVSQIACGGAHTLVVAK